MHSILFPALLIGVVPSVSTHGHIVDPSARMPGNAMEAQEMQIAQGQSDFNAAKCELTLCKGYQFADNTANVQSFTAGQVVNLKAVVTAPHTGTMNVSVVDTTQNAVIGDPLIYFPVYASDAAPIPPNSTAFSVTMPDVSSQCGTAGVCALQWHWNAADVNQTY
ncbi:hypothetical protein NA57DRAFT_63492 [Rhizodiscina lignyota]|uniref:Chitin-binding type-4 domain-containing protein n=1 Tax=Rhizodiscina lignyota TaxID=1504668 RepID=A0A9P4IK32_9PEZI|nr:hypothetical protein NA57DRAFT_63492 [Rhizodiscina lignyota]